MEHGADREEPIVGSDVEDALGVGVDGVRDVAMGVHRQLGHAGCPRGAEPKPGRVTPRRIGRGVVTGGTQIVP